MLTMPTSLQWLLHGFAWPWCLLALPLPLLALWLLPRRRNNATALRVPYGARLQAIAAAGGRSMSLGGVGVLVWLAWALLCVAAARPLQLGDAVMPPQAGRELMLVVDLSGSMAETDMLLGGRRVDRLTAVKAVLSDFIERRQGDRIGLIVFGQRAYVLTPLTLDHASVRQQLATSVVSLAGRETAIGDAIGLAVKRLQVQADDDRSDAQQPVVILLTDGVNTAGVLEPRKAAELARDAGVRVHTIAFGGEGGGLSMFGLRLPGPRGDSIDEDMLESMADMTGGQFFRARDTQSLAGIYAQIERIEPVQQPGKAVRPRIERYPWPLGAALACALLAFALPRRRLA